MPFCSGLSSFLRVIATAGAVCAAGAALAHPHVLVSVKSDFMLDASGHITGIRHAWTFDEAYSAYAVVGIKAGPDGKIARENLADLAKVNIESLQDFAYFTSLKQGKKTHAFANPAEGFYLDHDGKALTLHFVLPLKASVPAEKTTVLDVTDESFFVSFSFAETDPVRIEGPAKSCRVEMKRPQKALPSTDPTKLTEDFFNGLRPGGLEQFSSAARLVCP